MARILVLDGHCWAALAFVRSLARAGHWVAVGSATEGVDVAGLSRYSRASWSYPSPLQDAPGACQVIGELTRKYSIDLVIPMTDATVWPLITYQGYLRSGIRLGTADRDSLIASLDKHRTICIARECGVPTPRTILVQSPADLLGAKDWSFPVVLKDRYSVRWVGTRGVGGGVAFAHDWGALAARVAEHLGTVGDVLIQEFCPGKGVGFGCLAIDGEVFLPFQWERVREKDPRGSGSSARRSIAVVPSVLEYAHRLLGAIRYTGLVMVEYKQRGSDFYLMEINARPWGSIQLPIHCGIDYPNQVVRWYLHGRRPEKRLSYSVGITSRCLVDDLVHLENVWGGSPNGWPEPYPNIAATALRVLTPWYPTLRYDDLWLSDPRPAMVALARWFRQHWKWPAGPPVKPMMR